MNTFTCFIELSIQKEKYSTMTIEGLLMRYSKKSKPRSLNTTKKITVGLRRTAYA